MIEPSKNDGLQQQNFGIYSTPNKMVIHPTRDYMMDYYIFLLCQRGELGSLPGIVMELPNWNKDVH